MPIIPPPLPSKPRQLTILKNFDEIRQYVGSFTVKCSTHQASQSAKFRTLQIHYAGRLNQTFHETFSAFQRDYGGQIECLITGRMMITRSSVKVIPVCCILLCGTRKLVMGNSGKYLYLTTESGIRNAQIILKEFNSQ